MVICIFRVESISLQLLVCKYVCAYVILSQIRSAFQLVFTVHVLFLAFWVL